MTLFGLLQAALPAPAHVAGPACGGKEVEDVRAAQQADHLAPLDDRDAPYALSNEQLRGLVDAGVRADRDDVLAHDVARDLSLLGEDVGLRHDPNHLTVRRDHRTAIDSL